ncbi:tyrosine-type recombinase/integrase [Sulfurimonas sp.]|uniref:tyrosine-type recombinase/integrase n=1 Tax=Sulfurimonas sp. TaxID=2022749 RepID=UPI0025D64938|nr:tyrosine-type recombinase/integrase [Sulfurimonas sp.]MCK9455237.1 site-specific integrase [Sulfurimonas sp.]
MSKFINSKKYEGVQYYIKADGTKSYYVRYKDEENRLKRVKIGDETDGTTEVYCRNKRIEILNAQNKGEQPPKIVKNHRKKVLTLNEVADKYFTTKDSSRSTFDRISKYKKHLAPILGHRGVTSITKNDLISIQDSIIKEQNLSPQTANMVIELFGTIFIYGFKEEMYEAVNPTLKVQKFKVRNTRERFLNKLEIEELFDAAKQYDEKNANGGVLELFTKLALTTGARMESVLNIKKCDIDLQNDIIRLVDLKNGGEVYSGYITDTTRELLYQKSKAIKFTDYLISFNNNGKKIGARQLQTRLKPLLDDLFNQGLDVKDRKNRIVIHSLRHTCASQLAMANVPILQIQELLNHADISQTVRYAKLQGDANKKAIQGVF